MEVTSHHREVVDDEEGLRREHDGWRWALLFIRLPTKGVNLYRTFDDGRVDFHRMGRWRWRRALSSYGRQRGSRPS